MHACISQPPSEKLEGYFELSFYKIDWRQLAKEFYNENADTFFTVPVADFFSNLDVSDVIDDIKKMFVENEDVITFNDDE